MKRPKRKIAVFFFVGALIVGMGVSISMGLAIGSLTDALLRGDGQPGVSTPPQEHSIDQIKPAVLRKRISKPQPESEKKKSVVLSTRPSTVWGPAADTPKRKAAAPDADNLWEGWSPEKVLRQLNHPWPGVSYAQPTGVFPDPIPDNWQSTYPTLADQNKTGNMFAGASIVPGGNDSPFSYSGGGSFTSGGGSLSAKDGNSAGAIETRMAVAIPVPPSIFLLFSVIVGLVCFRHKSRINANV